MIDIHSHVLPFIDDGSNSIDESVNLLKNAKECGVTKIIATPHFKNNFKASIKEINDSYNAIKPFAEELGIGLYLGQEIKHYSGDINNVIEKKHLTLNNTKAVLVEFDMVREEDVSEVIYSYCKKGFIPIVAHVERYPYCLDFSVIEDIKNCGGMIQINASSVVGKLGGYIKKFVLKLIKFGLVDFVASDIHSFRENDMLKAYNLIKKKFKEQVANNLFINHQQQILFSGKFDIK